MRGKMISNVSDMTPAPLNLGEIEEKDRPVYKPMSEIHNNRFNGRAALQDQERLLISRSPKTRNTKKYLGVLSISTQEMRVRRQKAMNGYLWDNQQVEEVCKYHIQPSFLSWCFEIQVMRSAHHQTAFTAKRVQIISGPNEIALKQIFFDRNLDRFKEVLKSGIVSPDSFTTDKYSLLLVCSMYSVLVLD